MRDPSNHVLLTGSLITKLRTQPYDCHANMGLHTVAGHTPISKHFHVNATHQQQVHWLLVVELM